MSKRRDPNPTFDLFIPLMNDLPLKDQREVMERPFFSLQKRKRLKPIEYRSPDGEAWVKVEAMPAYGMATIWDADILIWAASVLNRMKEQGTGGAIVATSSISALVGGGMQTHYTPTKAGVHSLMQSIAIALGPYGVRCNSVMPGAILTDLNREDLEDEEKLAYFGKRIPLGRIGQPRDVATCVAFLASDMAAYVTGASLLVDGGMFVNLQ